MAKMTNFMILADVIGQGFKTITWNFAFYLKTASPDKLIIYVIPYGNSFCRPFL